MKLSTTAFLAASVLSVSTTVFSVEVQSQSLTSKHQVDLDDAKFVQFLQNSFTENHVVDSLLEMREEFIQWSKKFEKVYHSIEDEVGRMTIWLENHGT